MSTAINKDEAKALIDRMPTDATWDDLIQEICAVIAINRGLADVAAGRYRPLDEVRREFGFED